jgi:hypothetical protein
MNDIPVEQQVLGPMQLQSQQYRAALTAEWSHLVQARSAVVLAGLVWREKAAERLMEIEESLFGLR